MSVSSSSLNLNNLYSNPQLLGSMFPNINVSAIQSEFQAEQITAQLPLTQLSQQESNLSTPIQAWQAMQGDLQNLQSDAAALAGSSLYQDVAASSSSSGISATSTGLPGTPGLYTIGPANGNTSIVLAQDEIVNASPQSSESTALNLQGSFTVDGKTVDVGKSDTLQSIADAINSAGAGVSATVLTPPGGGYVLSLQGDNATPMSFTDPNGILSLFGIALGSQGQASSPAVAAQYAQYSVNGVDVTKGTSNTDSSSIPGISFTLTSTGGGTVDVSQNTGSIATAVQQFVTDFNQFLTDSQQYAGKGGALEGDATLSAITSQLFQMLDAVVPGQPSSLNTISQAGLSISAPVDNPSDFTMSLNSSTLQSALADNPGSFASFWSGSDGVMTQINSLLTNELGAQGGVTQALGNLQQQQQSLAQQIANPDSAVNQVVNNQMQALQSQFSTLMQSMVSFNSQGSMVSAFVNQMYGQNNSSSSSGG